tara:strand:- start:363 stop:599 length:237 start_codon:yes stop_codon:yes gene_type:complete
MNVNEVTQNQIDEIHPLALEDWDTLLKESGESELMFKVSHEGVKFMAIYQSMKEHAESKGFTMPELFGDGTKITFHDE